MHGTPVKSCMITRAGRELDLGVGLGVRIPAGQRARSGRGDVRAVLGAQQVLEQHLEAEGQLLLARDGVDAEDLDLVSRHVDRVTRTKAVRVGARSRHRGS